VAEESTERKNLRVRVRGESWRASSETEQYPVKAGQAVRVVDRKGLLLIVRPEESDGDNMSFF
jgi:membrane protein implicated in regulation of membrane protease activity